MGDHGASGLYVVDAVLLWPYIPEGPLLQGHRSHAGPEDGQKDPSFSNPLQLCQGLGPNIRMRVRKGTITGQSHTHSVLSLPFLQSEVYPPPRLYSVPSCLSDNNFPSYIMGFFTFNDCFYYIYVCAQMPQCTCRRQKTI